MKPSLRQALRFAPLVIGLALLVLGAVFVPWDKVWPYLRQISPAALGVLVALSLVYHLGRALRYWLTVRMLGQPTSFGIVLLACLEAQPISVLPGGELYRSLMLRRYGNISLREGAPSVFSQSLAESIGLVGIALIGASIFRRYLGLTLIIAAVFALIWFGIRFYRGHRAHRIPNLLPGVNFHPSRVRAYLDRNRVLLSGRNFVVLLLASLVSTAAGIGILAVAAAAIGHPIGIVQAAIAYSLATTLEAVSFLPGGLGANEGSSVGILIIFHVGLAPAIAITIIVRLFTLVIGFGYGFAAMALARILQLKRYD